MLRRFLWLFLAAALIPGAEAHPQSVDTVGLRTAIANAGGRVIIALKSTRRASLRAPGQPPVDAPEMAAIEARLARRYPLQISGRAGMVSALFATVADSDVGRVLADSNVELLVPDGLGVLADASESPRTRTSESTPWGITTVGAPQAWAAGLTGAGVKVAVIDGGIDYTHPDLNVAGGYDFTTASAAPSAYTDNVASCNGHGTHIAGTVAARQDGAGLVGVAPGAQLYALKVFQDMGGSCLAWESNQIAALNWAVTNGVRVVNISIGNVSYNAVYQNAITTAIANGVTVVAAAGNSGGGAVGYPAAYAGVVAVGALDQGNAPASYESVGPQMWIAAPGTNILSTMPGGGTGFKSGTSMATPHVVGVTALLLQANPGWTAANVQLALKTSAIDIATAGFDNYTGWGLVQAPSGGSGNVPVVLAVSPAVRSVSVQQGNAGPGDNASVTLTGTNASTTAWSATKKKTWTTLTIASGTGSGTVAWTRDASALGVGTYVDTITVTSAGVTGSPALIYDTIKVTGIIPVAMTVTPGARSVSVSQGSAAPGDNAAVTLTGTNAGPTTWTATKKKTWTTLTNAIGVGNGSVTWTRSTGALTVGTYVDTITVTSPGVIGSPAVVYDTIRITTGTIPVAMTVTPTARHAFAQQGTVAPGDNATVTLTGTNAATTAWSATSRKSWTTLTTTSGVGSGAVTWTRNAGALAVGTYVDTITVMSAGSGGSPAAIYDTLSITSVAPPAVVLTLNPAARSVSVQQGNAAPGDNVTVTLTGTNAAATSWSASRNQGWATLTSAAGTGSGFIAWTRNASGLAPGTYVDTITVTANGIAGSPWAVYDTLKVTAAPVALMIAVTPGARTASVQQGNAAPGDYATIALTGTNAVSTAWSASNRRSWSTLTAAGGTGSGTVTWIRNTGGLAVGTYVDTITVTSPGISGSPAVVYDTLRITAAAIPVTIAVSPGSRHVAVQQGDAAPGDNASIALAGTDAGSTAWLASRSAAWASLSLASGTGNGDLSWTRDATGLAAGTYVDTIRVTAATGVRAELVDSLVVTAKPSGQGLHASPGGRKARVVTVAGLSAAISQDSVLVQASGSDALQWAAMTHAPWMSLILDRGPTPSILSWSRNSAGLAPGLYVDSIIVTVASVPDARAVVMDTLEIVSVTLPAVEIAAQDLFTPGQVSGEQREALDQLGNHNGRYDLGDFLAWIHRANIRLTPGLAKKVMTLQGMH